MIKFTIVNILGQTNILDLKKENDKTLKNIPTCGRGFAENSLEGYENCADHLSNNLRLNEISVLTFFQFYCKINRNQSKTVVESIYGLYPNQCFEILNLKFRGRSLVTRRFRFHSNSQGADEIIDLPILIDFCIQKHGVITPVQCYIAMPRLIGICRIQRCRSRFFVLDW